MWRCAARPKEISRLRSTERVFENTKEKKCLQHPARADLLGMTRPSAKELGIDERELYREMCAMGGKTYAVPPPVNQWPLHLKVTFLDVEAVFATDTQRDETKRFPTRAFLFMSPESFSKVRTSRVIRATKPSASDL